jgi:hypothetical protein
MFVLVFMTIYGNVILRRKIVVLRNNLVSNLAFVAATAKRIEGEEPCNHSDR